MAGLSDVLDSLPNASEEVKRAIVMAYIAGEDYARAVISTTVASRLVTLHPYQFRDEVVDAVEQAFAGVVDISYISDRRHKERAP